MEITEQEFQAYEEVRRSGVTNMWDTRRVSRLSGLDRETILEIIKSYSDLTIKYPNVRQA